MYSRPTRAMVRVAGTRRSEAQVLWRRARIFVIAAALFALVLLQSESITAGPCWAPPVDARTAVVIDPFREPPCPWCAGNRGIEYEVERSTVVRAAATGRVTFSGAVVGTRYVVIQVARGWRLTYGKLESTHLSAGDSVVTGSVVGRTTGDFFFGVRLGNVYLDPAQYLGRMVGRPRLIPTDGTSPRLSTPTRLRCEQALAPR